MLRPLLALLTLLLMATAAAQDAPGLHIEPTSVQPGQQMSFLLVFPDDATGDATLRVGDGRTETVNTAVGEVELPLDAPSEPGSYTARLSYESSSGMQHHSVKYIVEGEQRSPLPAWIFFVLLPLAAFLRK